MKVWLHSPLHIFSEHLLEEALLETAQRRVILPITIGSKRSSNVPFEKTDQLIPNQPSNYQPVLNNC